MDMPFNFYQRITLLFIVLLIIESFFLFVSLDMGYRNLGYDNSIAALLRITSENNLPTWVSSVQLLFVGLVAWRIARVHQGAEQRALAIAWFVIFGFFIYMSMDDGARFHERVASAFKRYLEANTDGNATVDVLLSFPSYSWQIFFLPIFVGLGVFMTIFLYRAFNNYRLFLLFLTGIGCYAFAVGLDYIDGLDDGFDWFIIHYDYEFKEIQFLFRCVEEFVEMFGTTLILISFLLHQHVVLKLRA